MKFFNTLKRTWDSVRCTLSSRTIKRGRVQGSTIYGVTKCHKVQSTASSSSSRSSEMELPITYIIHNAVHSADAFDSLQISPSYHSMRVEPEMWPASPSSSSIASLVLSPNAGLFRSSQQDFGFDVWVPAKDGVEDPACIACPTILSWDQLVVRLVSETQRSKDDVAFFNAHYVGVISDAEDYEAWLELSRENENNYSSNTNLWLI